MRQPFPHLRQITRPFRLALQFFVNHGPRRGLRLLATCLHPRRTRPLPALFDLFPRHIPASFHPFDQTYHVDTSGFHHGEDLGDARGLHLALSSSHAASSPSTGILPSSLWNTAYYGIAPSLFDGALALIGSPATGLHPADRADLAAGTKQSAQTAPDWSRFTFVDLGCGKGRALLLASRSPFRQVLGIELDGDLAAIAQANLHAFHAPWQQCHALAVLHADATAIDLPPTPILLYLYHPFLAPALKRVLRRLERSLRQNPRELWLVYINPEAAHVLRGFPILREQIRTTLVLEPEDALPDRLGSSQEEVAIYHYLPSA